MRAIALIPLLAPPALSGCGEEDEPVEPEFRSDAITIHLFARGEDGACQPQAWRAAGKDVAVAEMAYDLEYAADGAAPIVVTGGAGFGDAPKRDGGVRLLKSQGAFFGIDAPCDAVTATVSEIACFDADGGETACPDMLIGQGGGLKSVVRK